MILIGMTRQQAQFFALILIKKIRHRLGRVFLLLETTYFAGIGKNLSVFGVILGLTISQMANASMSGPQRPAQELEDEQE